MPVFFHEDFLRHRQTSFHPERPERLERVMQVKDQLELDVEIATPTAATVDQLERVHDGSYLDIIKHFGEGYYDMDTYVRPETYDIAILAAGAGIAAAIDTLRNDRSNIALTRPPGHHSGRNYAGGFCYLNNIAIAARALQAEEDLKRVAVLDFDVHHGNGTSDVFYKDRSILYISTHQWGIYPGTGRTEAVGEEDGEGFNINVPFRGGAGDSSMKEAMERLVEPVVSEFLPEAILVSLGGDAHYADPLAGLTMSSPGYVDTYLVGHRLAKELGLGGAVYFLEGGYDVDALAEVVWGISEGFEGRDIEYSLSEVADTEGVGKGVVDEVVRIHRDYWDL
jgi:acetoin utilization deacetylase AcuC-like enzyme